MIGFIGFVLLIIAVLFGGFWFISLISSKRDLPRCGST
jgi:hypothetical protein